MATEAVLMAGRMAGQTSKLVRREEIVMRETLDQLANEIVDTRGRASAVDPRIAEAYV